MLQVVKKSSRTEIPEVCFILSDVLINFVSSKHALKVSGTKRRSWADTIRKMHTCDGIEYDTIAQVLSWYVNYENHTQYCPVIESAKSLRDKWVKIINYGKRLFKEKNSVQSGAVPDGSMLAAINRIKSKGN